jgi:monoamine oxidase
VHHLDKVHPGTRREASVVKSKCWDDDRFARGAYPWYGPGDLTELQPALATAEGRILFAGDGTSTRAGFMHGAVASAERVVKELEARLDTPAYIAPSSQEKKPRPMTR